MCWLREGAPCLSSFRVAVTLPSAVLKNCGLDNLTRAVRLARDDVLGRMATFVPSERAAAPGRNQRLRAAIDDALAATTRGEAMSPDDTTTATARDDRTGTPDAVEHREVPDTLVVRATCAPRRIVARVRPRPSDSAIEHAYLPVSVLVGPGADDPHWTWLRASAEALREFAGHATEAQDPDALQMAAVELDCMHDAIRDALRPAHPASASANRRDLKLTRSTVTREQKRLAHDRAAQLALRRAAMDIDTALAELDALPDDNRPAGIHEETRRLRRRLRTLERAVLADMRKTDDSAREVSCRGRARGQHATQVLSSTSGSLRLPLKPKEIAMRDIATAQLSGNLTRDVDLRELPSGAEVARLRVATTTRRRTGDNQWGDKANYFTVEVFGAQARNCAQYLRKGSRVFVEAELDWREWTDPQDNKREAVTFRARQVLFEGPRTENANGAAPATAAPPAAQPTTPPPPAPVAATVAATATGTDTATADDLPF